MRLQTLNVKYPFLIQHWDVRKTNATIHCTLYVQSDLWRLENAFWIDTAVCFNLYSALSSICLWSSTINTIPLPFQPVLVQSLWLQGHGKYTWCQAEYLEDPHGQENFNFIFWLEPETSTESRTIFSTMPCFLASETGCSYFFMLLPFGYSQQ